MDFFNNVFQIAFLLFSVLWVFLASIIVTYLGYTLIGFIKDDVEWRKRRFK